MNSLLKRTTGDDAGPKLDINRYKGEGKLKEIQNSWEATERAGGRLPRVASCLHLPKRMGPNRHPFGRPTSRSDRTESTVLLAALWPNELVPAYSYHIGAGKPQSAPVAAFLALLAACTCPSEWAPIGTRSEGRLLGRTGLKARSCWLPSGLMSWAQPIRIT